MLESDDDLARLQMLIDRTFAHANPHLAQIVKRECRLNARQVVRFLQGTKHVAFATVNDRGEPRVAPSTVSSSVGVHGLDGRRGGATETPAREQGV
jgi:hypothetical protein